MPQGSDLVGLGDIAEMCGVRKNSVWRWTRRDDFPPPAARISDRIPVWRRRDVERWAAKTLPLPQGRRRKR